MTASLEGNRPEEDRRNLEIWQATRRAAATWWPTSVAVFVLAFAPRTDNPLWTLMQAVAAVFLAFALRQFERHLLYRIALILGLRAKILHRSRRPAPPAARPGTEGRELS